MDGHGRTPSSTSAHRADGLAQPAQLEDFAISEDAVDVGEPGAEPDPNGGKSRPAFPGAGKHPADVTLPAADILELVSIQY